MAPRPRSCTVCRVTHGSTASRDSAGQRRAPGSRTDLRQCRRRARDRRPLLDLVRSPYLTNCSLLDVDFVPPHLVIVGGSYVGLEFAQIYRRFGSEVTVVEMAPRLI